MKKFISFLLVAFLFGCATTGQRSEEFDGKYSGELDGTYMICDKGGWGEEKFGWKDLLDLYRGFHFTDGTVITSKIVVVRTEKIRTQIIEYRPVLIWYVEPKYVVWLDGFESYRRSYLDRHTLEVSEFESPSDGFIRTNRYLTRDCELVKEEDYLPKLRKHMKVLTEHLVTEHSKSKL